MLSLAFVVAVHQSAVKSPEKRRRRLWPKKALSWTLELQSATSVEVASRAQGVAPYTGLPAGSLGPSGRLAARHTDGGSGPRRCLRHALLLASNRQLLGMDPQQQLIAEPVRAKGWKRQGPFRTD